MSELDLYRAASVQVGPDGMPVLSRGQHIDPHDGACVMETVSVLAGEPWSDRPRCTHPALAELARLVNDSCPATAYPDLALLAPDLIGTAGADARLAPALVLGCIGALRSNRLPVGVLARTHERWARRRLARASRPGRLARAWVRASDPVYRTGPARHAMAGAVCTLGVAGHGSASERLVGLLREAIGICRAAAPRTPERAGLSPSRSR